MGFSSLENTNQMMCRNKMLFRLVNTAGGPHRMLQVHGAARATHVSPLCASLRTPTWSRLPNSVLCGTGLWMAIFAPKWTSLDALTSVGEVSADYSATQSLKNALYNEKPLCAPKSTDLQRRSRVGSFQTWQYGNALCLQRLVRR